MSDADDGGEWRFALEDLPEEEGDAAGTEERAESDGEEPRDGEEGSYGGNVAGQVAGLNEDIEAGTPSLEHAAFVVLGALATVVFVLAMIGYI